MRGYPEVVSLDLKVLDVFLASLGAGKTAMVRRLVTTRGELWTQ